VDHVVASLILNYVSDPHEFLVDVQRVLRANGTMVLSVLRTDADTSRICVEGILELRQGKALESFGGEGEVAADRALGSFVNDAAKLLDLEEQGIFRFWDQGELVDAVAAAGFAISETKSVFGTPPQASLVVANKRA
jgi:ubiquinone/menaquinone biosynthesis C-methylase UbiE